MSPLLSVDGLTKTFALEQGIWRRSAGEVRAVDHVSFEVMPGETLAIVGGSGSGKSTLARVLVGLLPASEGRALWKGNSMGTWSQRFRAAHLQMIFQDPYASLNPKLSVATQLGDGVRLAAQRERETLTRPQVQERAGQWLNQVGLSAEVLPRYPFQFSGGQRQRIAIARALALKPQLLIADEPLSALDVTVQAQMLDLLAALKRELRLTLIFITHDLAILPGFADRILVMQDGRIVESGDTSRVLARPAHAYTQSLLEALPPALP